MPDAKRSSLLTLFSIVAIDPRYFRRTEVDTLLGDPTKAREKLGWRPKVTFDELVAEMIREDLVLAKRDQMVEEHGYQTFNHFDDFLQLFVVASVMNLVELFGQGQDEELLVGH